MPRVTIVIDVPNLEAATSFYCDALGCTLLAQRATHNTVELAGIPIHLALRENGSNATPSTNTQRNYSRHWTPVHLDFDVDNVDDSVASVERLGGTIEQRKSGDWGSAAFCSDPFGNGFCLLSVDEPSHSPETDQIPGRTTSSRTVA